MSDIYSWENNEVINRHKKRWCEGSDSDSALNQAIENFNDLVDNKLAPTVHCVECTKPFEWDINNKFKTNVLISDV